MKLTLGVLLVTLICLSCVNTQYAFKKSRKDLRNLAKLVHSLHITRHLQENQLAEVAKPAEEKNNTSEDLRKLGKLANSLHITRLLQEKKAAEVAKPAEEKKHTPITLPPTNHFGSWKTERESFYAKETERLAAQTRFHNSEFQRYVLQTEMNEKRKAITDDESKSILDRRNAVKELQDEYKTKIGTEDAKINTFQNLRNPANNEANRGWEKFWVAYEKANKERSAMNNAIKPDTTTRRLQAVVSYTDAQKSQITALKAAWKKQYETLKTSYTLNKKFHTVEFVEFQIDMNRLTDMKVIWEDPKMSLWEKNVLWNSVDKQYREKRSEAKAVINTANKTRQDAQNLVWGVDGDVMKVDRAGKYFKWATLTGSG